MRLETSFSPDALNAPVAEPHGLRHLSRTPMRRAGRFLGRCFLDHGKLCLRAQWGSDPDDHYIQRSPPSGGAIEQCQANERDGKFYLSIPLIDNTNPANTIGAVLRISAQQPSFHVEKVFKIQAATGCAGPPGLTIGLDHQILVGCNGTSTQSVIIDDRDNNRRYMYVPTTTGVDEVRFDRGSNHYYYLAQSSAAIMGVEDAGHGKTLPNPDPNASTAMGACA
jgi:hypothetical protein